MSHMKRFRLAALCVVAAALLAGTPADAAPWTALTPTGAEPGASGEAKRDGNLTFLGRDVDPWFGWWLWFYSGDLSVRCHGLAPNATYMVCWNSGGGWDGCFPLVTDALGEGASVGQVVAVVAISKNGPGIVDVSVYRADGTLVLSGHARF